MAHRFVVDGSGENAEYQMLQQGCGIVDNSMVSVLQMTGEDRQRYLNGLVTCDTKSLASGEGCHGFVTSLKGRILAYLVVLVTDDSLWLQMSPHQAEAIGEHLSKYIIVDRVEIGPLAWLPLALVGPKSAEVLGRLGLPVDELTVHQHGVGEWSGQPVRAVRYADLGTTPQWGLWLPADSAVDLYGDLIKEAQKVADAGPVGFGAYERLRIESGWPLFGVDYNADNFPQETGLEDAVNYTKGCYLGQEIVARIHYRGGVNKSLRHVRLAEGALETGVGHDIRAEDRPAGTLTSLTATDDGLLGLAILHQRVEDGAHVEIEGQGLAHVAALP